MSQLYWPSLWDNFGFRRYLQDINNGTHSPAELNETEHVDEAVRNPLAMFRIVRTAAFVRNSEQEGW